MTKTKTAAERTIRRTTAKWTFNGEPLGETEEREIEILFYGLTVKQVREESARLEAAKGNESAFYLSDVLLNRLHSIPEFQVGIGHPNKIDLDWLESQDVENLSSASTAIAEAIGPKAPPAKSQNG
jgi:hypothetical protein